jgi:hypothetical protein
MKKDDMTTGDAATPSEQKPVSKKDQIISLFTAGIEGVDDLAMITGARPSYVASVLQKAGLITGYFDLYTTSAQQMNVYSRFFAGRLGFKDLPTAKQSVDLINRLYRQFGVARDRAGQHHALVMAMTMFDRARWTGKQTEAEVFRRWLLEQLQERQPSEPPPNWPAEDDWPENQATVTPLEDDDNEQRANKDDAPSYQDNR